MPSPPMNGPANSPAMSDRTISWSALWDETARRLGRTQARWMCEVASGLDGDEFFAALDEPATQRCVAHLDSMLTRLAAGEPLQYVLGRWGFRHLDLMIDQRVLIPRPETETVVEIAFAVPAVSNVTRSRTLTPATSACRMPLCRRARWSRTTPFGSPVEPDV